MSSALGGLSAESTASTMRISNDTIIVSDLFNLVKTYDKEFNPKPSSLVVDDSGKYKKVYHGTGGSDASVSGKNISAYYVERISAPFIQP